MPVQYGQIRIGRTRSCFLQLLWGDKNLIKGLLSGWSRRAGGKGDILALTLNDNSLRYVLASAADARGATITAWGTELRGSQTRDAFLKRTKTILPVAERVIAVLDPREYQILQIDAPNVPAEELHSAVRWRAMEFVDGSPHDYTLDVLTVPAEPARTGVVIAVIAHNDVVRTRMLDCVALGCPLSVIDVAETSLRNLLYAVLQAESAETDVAAALVADAGRALMVIVVNGQLYFFRRFEFDTDLLAVAVDELQSALVGTGAGEDAVSRSLMQLHRSLDLWEDSYPHLPLRSLHIDAGAKTGAILTRLQPETGVDTRMMALSTIFKVPVSRAPPPWLDGTFLPLLGALLRPAEVR